MINFGNTYDIQIGENPSGIRYLFVSEGVETIVKAIQYSFVQQYKDQDVYNLGFGDYDIETDLVDDTINSNNGDGHKVLYTVLSTIPLFFEKYPKGVLMVHGSDDHPEFIAKCKESCQKKCGDDCKNFKRRINIYRGFVNKNYDALIPDYQFLGGFKEEGKVFVEEYIQHKPYDSVLVFKRNN